jgi:hypothetical protein
MKNQTVFELSYLIRYVCADLAAINQDKKLAELDLPYRSSRASRHDSADHFIGPGASLMDGSYPSSMVSSRSSSPYNDFMSAAAKR